MRETKWAVVSVLALLGLAGCGGPGVGDVCAELESRDCENWSGQSACEDDGSSVQKRASAAGCDGAFSIYLSCLAQADGCDWQSMCSAQRADVEACIGEL